MKKIEDYYIDRKLQKKILEVLEYLDSFCNNNGIEYSIAYGTVLGAKRHKGFIPWDDDIDVYMTVKNYKKFKERFTEHGDNIKFYLQELNPVEGMFGLAKIRMNGTTFIEEGYSTKKIHQGIYVDIFLLHSAPKNIFKRIIMMFASHYLTLKDLANKGYNTDGVIGVFIRLLRRFSKNFGRKYALRILYRYDNNENSTYIFDNLRKFGKSFYPRTDIFPTAKMEFEGNLYNSPNKADKYLRRYYGDYMKYPSLSSIEKKQHSTLWDTEKDFHEYLPYIDEYSDEIW